MTWKGGRQERKVFAFQATAIYPPLMEVGVSLPNYDENVEHAYRDKKVL
jgi:hypothetical protein